MHDHLTILRLLSINGLGTRRILNLAQHFDDLSTVFSASLRQLCSVPMIDQVLAQRIRAGWDDNFVTAQQNMLAQQPFRVISYFDADYPSRLKDIFDPPILLFLQGQFIESDADAVAIVGTRTPTTYGREVTEYLVKRLCENNLTIVSGFARGVDTIAHKAALQCGGRTIAVLGTGIDRVYPPENRQLRNRIVENGVYCSEFPFGTKPDAVNFPRRNRLISGLGLGVVVIEAGEKSGALLTAYYGLDQDREVFAVPGRIFDEKSRGTNQLLQKGARLVADVDDILNEIDPNRKFPQKARQLELQLKFENADEQSIYDVLSREPLHIDEIAGRLNKSTYEILATLLTLELKGAVRQLAGKMFVRAG